MVVVACRHLLVGCMEAMVVHSSSIHRSMAVNLDTMVVAWLPSPLSMIPWVAMVSSRPWVTWPWEDMVSSRCQELTSDKQDINDTEEQALGDGDSDQMKIM